MTTQIKGLMFAAAVATLSAACGTSGSPTGMDVSGIEASAGFSALRSEPTTPQAPEPQSPESDPLPGDPGPVPEADTKPLDPKDDVTSVPVPSNRPNRPLPGTVPNASPDAVPDAGSDTVPPTGSEPGSAIPPPPQDPTPGPAPAPPSEPSGKCAAISMEIVALTNIAAPTGVAFMAILTDKAGARIEDLSCEKLIWTVEGGGAGSAITITFGDTSRFVTVDGTVGAYKIGASAPNGVSTSMAFGGGK